MCSNEIVSHFLIFVLKTFSVRFVLNFVKYSWIFRESAGLLLFSDCVHLSPTIFLFNLYDIHVNHHHVMLSTPDKKVG